MKHFHFTFHQISDKVVITPGSRTSAWIEGHEDFLLPCEFVDVLQKNSAYHISVLFIDSESFNKTANIGKKFYFGLPTSIIGSGILKSIK